jgi:hypothetical protein
MRLFPRRKAGGIVLPQGGEMSGNKVMGKRRMSPISQTRKPPSTTRNSPVT